MRRRIHDVVGAFWVLALVFGLAGCGCGDDDDDDDSAVIPDDDDADDDSADDDADDDTGDDDTWPPLPDDDADDDADDDTQLPDDYIASWPQSNVANPGYDESPSPGDLREKADEHDEWHKEWHQPGYGGNVHATFSDDTHTTITGYQGWGDSCIWTGTYLGSQALRYHATGDPVAKDNAMRMVDVLAGYYYVTETPGFIARYWAPQSLISYQGHPWCEAQDRCHHVESGEYAGDWWWGETSRDQYTGWFYGMALAYDLIDDEDTRQTIRDVMTEVLDGVIANHWTIIDEAGERTDAAPDILPPQALDWALIGYHVTGEERFADEVRIWIRDAKRTHLRLSSIALLNRYAQYYGNNLAHTNWFNLLRLGKAYFSPEDYAFLLEVFDTQVHTFTRLSHNPWFTAIFMSTDAYVPERDDPYQDQIEEDLAAFPAPPNVQYFLDARVGWTPDPLSVLLNDLQTQFPFLEELMGEANVQAIEAFPVDQQCSSGFMFQRNPFDVEACGSDTPTIVNSGHDYLAAYWLAAYLGRLTKDQ